MEKHLWADDVEQDEAEEQQQRQQRRGGGSSAAAAPAPARTGGTSLAGIAAAAAGLGPARGARPEAPQQQHYEEYDDADLAAFREGRYEARDGWHEGMEVERGKARHRIDLQHGFVRDIVSGWLLLVLLPSVWLHWFAVNPQLASV